jgi:hypothetical protein
MVSRHVAVTCNAAVAGDFRREGVVPQSVADSAGGGVQDAGERGICHDAARRDLY